MKESMKEFREKVQGGRIKSLKEDYFRYFSAYISRFFAKRTSLTGNQITFIWILFGLGAVVAYSVGSYWYTLLGGFLYFWRHTLDRVDGEVARYKGQKSIKGQVYDYFGHWIYEPLIFIGAGIGFYRITGQWLIFIPAFLALYGYYMTDLVNMCVKLYKPKSEGSISKHGPANLDNKSRIYRFLRKLFLVDYFHVVLLLCSVFNIMWFFIIINAVGLNFVWLSKVLSEVFWENY